MQRINNIEIKNFKSIRHQKIDGCRRINVFIGYPNVGKSNILEAIGLASVDSSYVNRRLDVDDFLRIEDSTSIFFNGDTNAPLQIIFNKEFRIKGIYAIDRIKISYERNPTELSFEQIDTANFDSVSLEDIFNKSGEISSMKDFFVGQGGISDYSQSSVFDRKTNARIKFPDIKKFIFNDKTKLYDGSSLVLEPPYGGNIFSVLSGNEQLRKNITELFKPFDLRFPFDKSTKSFKILKDVGDDIFIIPYKMIADTLRRLIFYKAAIATAKNSTLLFEEPEAQMFPPYIKKLTTDILMEKGGNQFFIATHSPYVLDELILEAEDELSIYLVDYKDGETKIHNLSKEDLHEIRKYSVDLFFNIESYLKHGQVNNS